MEPSCGPRIKNLHPHWECRTFTAKPEYGGNRSIVRHWRVRIRIVQLKGLWFFGQGGKAERAEASRIRTWAPLPPFSDLLALPWQLRQFRIMFPDTFILMSYILLLASLVPLVFKKDIAVYLFYRLSNFWGYEAPGRRPNAVGSGHFAASLWH